MNLPAPVSFDGTTSARWPAHRYQVELTGTGDVRIWGKASRYLEVSGAVAILEFDRADPAGPTRPHSGNVFAEEQQQQP